MTRRLFLPLILLLVAAPPVRAGLHYSGEEWAELPSRWSGFLVDQRSLRAAALDRLGKLPPSPLREEYLKAAAKLDLEQIDTGLSLFGKRLAAPILISSMTGGTPDAETINLRLAEAAQEMQIAMGVGSQRAALENPEQAKTFQVRRAAPDILLFANLGAVQLNYGYSIDQCRQAVEMIEADALIFHLNPLQEAVQDAGDTNFAGLAGKIEDICRKLEVPVIAKEVGWGISERTARLLADCGVAAIDVAGAGGTSWSQVEMYRAPDEFTRELAATFVGWGIPTADSILNVKKSAPHLSIFASGGLKDGLDIAKCIALGAVAGGLAGPFLKAADQSAEAVNELIRVLATQLRITMLLTGSRTVSELHKTPLTNS